MLAAVGAVVFVAVGVVVFVAAVFAAAGAAVFVAVGAAVVVAVGLHCQCLLLQALPAAVHLLPEVHLEEKIKVTILKSEMLPSVSTYKKGLQHKTMHGGDDVLFSNTIFLVPQVF